MIGHPEEAALVRAAKGGDREAFAALVDHYQRPLYAFCLRLLGNKENAEDTVQDAVVKALIGIHGLKNVEAFGGWLFRIARNECLQRWIRRKRHPEEPFPDNDDRVPVAVSEPSFTDEVHRHELAERVQRAFLELPIKQRAVLHLFFFEELSGKEIGKILNMRSGAVRANVRRGKLSIGKVLRDYL